MPPVSTAFIDKALALPPLERAGLIEKLPASFDQHSRTVIDSAWAVEDEKRLDAYESGATVAISLAESRERINRK